MKATKPASKVYTPSFDLVKPNLVHINTHLTALMYLSILPTLLYTLGTQLTKGSLLVNGKVSAHFTTRTGIGIMLIICGLLWIGVNIGPSTYFMVSALGKPAASVKSYYQQGLRFTLRLIGYYVVYGLMVLGGLLLLVLPGVLLFKRYFMGPYYLIDKDLSIRDALTASAAASKKASDPIWGVIGVQLAFTLAASVIGTIPLTGIVLSALIPYLYFFIPALRYKEIES